MGSEIEVVCNRRRPGTFKNLCQSKPTPQDPNSIIMASSSLWRQNHQLAEVHRASTRRLPLSLISSS
ncbi:hypothetical protein LIA77_01754 [Sarocladium implicatum]|nr:hypothetical protein LIA77_01754 [Sarocladium implicatum]